MADDSSSEEAHPHHTHTHTKLEEALEVKSLRRIISAYLNYSDAAEEDVKRYERSFRKLPPAHKALISHFSSKCRRLRRCISINSFFILNMLQAFEPPLDMSQDVDICECNHLEDAPKGCVSGERKFCSDKSSAVSRSIEISEAEADQICGAGQSDVTYPVLTGGTNIEEVLMIPETVNGSLFQIPESSEELEGAVDNDVKVPHDQTTISSTTLSNGNVSSPRRGCLEPSFQFDVPLVDVDKVRCIIRNIVRDWAPEGSKERYQCYKPILDELDRLFPSRHEGSRPCCLVPGAGLGRLALEISTLGFISQGNEFSYYMMICSSFILNHTQCAEEWTIYPWIHSNCNSLSDNDQLRAVCFPDIHPASAGITEGFSMCGGDFVEVYSDPTQVGAWDAVVTCFFLDTAHNVVEYIEIISRILKDGGVWINLGPLLYHFADAYGTEDEMSIELSLEDLKSVTYHYGFHLEQEQTIETTYTANPRSMMHNQYSAAFWTMTKKGER